MANELAHVGHYVLQNADKLFAKFKSGAPKRRSKKDPTNVYDKKKGRDFWTATDDSGKTTAMGFKAPSAICADGAPKAVAGDTYQATTSFQFTDGSQINADEIPYVVLPQQANGTNKAGKTIWASPDKVAGNPFHDSGVKRGDYVRVTNPENGKSVYAIYGENGPANEVGEISMAAARGLGINDSPISGGFTGMTDSQYLHYEFYPGSGKRSPNGSRIQTQTAEEIEKNGRIAAGGQMIAGGFVIASGNDTVLVGRQRQPAAFADPLCFHEGGCPLLLGSDTVFIEGRPTVRVGDSCTCGQKVVTGEPSVLVFGNPTQTGAQGAKAEPFSLWGANPQPASPFGPVDVFAPPAWARDALGSSGSGPPIAPSTPGGTEALTLAADALF